MVLGTTQTKVWSYRRVSPKVASERTVNEEMVNWFQIGEHKVHIGGDKTKLWCTHWKRSWVRVLHHAIFQGNLGSLGGILGFHMVEWWTTLYYHFLRSYDKFVYKNEGLLICEVITWFFLVYSFHNLLSLYPGILTPNHQVY